MSDSQPTQIRNRKRAALLAMGTLVLLAAAAMTSIQSLHDLSALIAGHRDTVVPLQLLSAATSPQRLPASADSKSLPKGDTEFRKTEGIIQNSITPEGPLPGPQGGVFQLKGISHVRANVRDMHYNWILPPSLRVRSGETQGLVSQLAAGEEKVFLLELEALTPGPHRVIFRSWVTKGQDAIGNSAHFIIGDDTALTAQGVQTQKRPLAPRSPEEFRRRAI
ncbi:MAG: hypothetical protein NDI61_01545, partial [Bdellovibrionaceae bacterium]|nr:hypothetical protein [Pseudobdellovibrionaceae bacterium]